MEICKNISQQDQVGYGSDGRTINYMIYNRLYPMAYSKYFSLFGLSIFFWKNIFIFKCGC